eukprot:g13871.t1
MMPLKIRNVLRIVLVTILFINFVKVNRASDLKRSFTSYGRFFKRKCRGGKFECYNTETQTCSKTKHNKRCKGSSMKCCKKNFVQDKVSKVSKEDVKVKEEKAVVKEDVVKVKEDVVKVKEDVMVTKDKETKTVEKEDRLDAKTKCATKYNGRCIDTRMEMCQQYPVIPGRFSDWSPDSFGCKGEGIVQGINVKTVQCCPGKPVQPPRRNSCERERGECMDKYWASCSKRTERGKCPGTKATVQCCKGEVSYVKDPKLKNHHENYEQCKVYYIVFEELKIKKLYPYKTVEGSCVDTFSNKDVCQTESGESKSTLTGQCSNGDAPVRCCPKYQWPTFSVTTNCDVADDKMECNTFKKKLKDSMHNLYKKAQFKMNNVITLKVNEAFENDDVEWDVEKKKYYDNYYFDPKNMKIVNNNHKEDYSTVEVSFLCEGIHQDPDLCFDLFPYDVNRQQLLYRLLQQDAVVRDFKDLSYVDVGYGKTHDNIATFETTNLKGRNRKFELKYKRTISMKDIKKCEEINFLNLREGEPETFVKELEKVHLEKEKTLQIIDCMRVKFDYEIFEVLKNGKLRDVGIVSHKVNENGSGGSRRRLLQAGGADS